MTYQVKKYSFADKFICLGDKCEDTCCKGWGMQLDSVRKDLYEKEAPELLSAITTGEAEIIMKRDPQTDYCVKFSEGICSIHKERSDKFLGDACHFYPRITRSFGGSFIMSAAASCPEIVRLALFEEDAFSLNKNDIDRIPVKVKDYIPKNMTSEKAEEIMAAFINIASDENTKPERIMAKIISVSNSLSNYQPERWSEGLPILIKMADGRLPEPETNHMDYYNLLHSFAALIYAAKKTERTRLEKVLNKIEEAIGIEINMQTLDMALNKDRENACAELEEKWLNNSSDKLAPILRRWLQLQLAMASFPFAGFGRNINEVATIIAVRFAFVRLALMSHMDEEGNPPDKEIIVRVIQSIARFIDHLADPELSINIYKENEWMREPRLRALIGDFIV